SLRRSKPGRGRGDTAGVGREIAAPFNAAVAETPEALVTGSPGPLAPGGETSMRPGPNAPSPARALQSILASESLRGPGLGFVPGATSDRRSKRSSRPRRP